MASHPDRVRRAYHTVKITETERMKTNDTLISISITKVDIASRASKREIEYMVFKLIQDAIKKGYRE